jgi:hypothetical protein
MQEAAVGLLDAAIVSSSPYCRRRTQPAQCQQWPNRCPRKAGVDDRTTQLTAVEPQTARPAVVGRKCEFADAGSCRPAV